MLETSHQEGSGDTDQTVLFADVVDSTGLFRRSGDAVAEALIREALNRANTAVNRYGGREIKRLGDELMAVLPSAEAAAKAAIDIQTEARQQGLIRFRIGFASGEVIQHAGDVFGQAPIAAKRLTDIAKAEQILTTEACGGTLPTTMSAMLRRFDRVDLKGLGETVVMQLVWDPRSHTQMIPATGDGAAHVRWIELQYRAQKLVLTNGDPPLKLGRHLECQLVVEGGLVSRNHAHVGYARGKFQLTDTSTNGTYVEFDSESGERRLMYARSESLFLMGSGRIALGKAPSEDEESVRFTVVDGVPAA